MSGAVAGAEVVGQVMEQSGCGEGEGQFGEGWGQGTGEKQRAAWLATKHKGALKPTLTPEPFYEVLQNKTDK